MDDDLKADYAFVFGSAEGERVLRHMLESCAIGEPTFDLHGRVENTFFNEGKRSVALMVVAMLDRDIAELTAKGTNNV